MQRALQAHAADVLWEAPGSRVGHHALALAMHAVRRVCTDTGAQPRAVPRFEDTVVGEEVRSVSCHGVDARDSSTCKIKNTNQPTGLYPPHSLPGLGLRGHYL